VTTDAGERLAGSRRVGEVHGVAIEREGEFLWTRDLGIVPSIGLESAQLDACIAEATARRATGVFGSPAFGFDETSLDCLRRLPWLTQVWFFDVNLANVDGLYALTELRYFGVHPGRPPIDFSAFPKLETVGWVHNPRDTGLDTAASVVALHLSHYKPRSRSYTDLRLPPMLELLEISWGNPASLAGLQRMPNLRRLELHRCRNLTSLEELPHIAPRLEQLVVTTSNRVTELGMLAELPRLQSAIVNGKTIVPSRT
jgi:hypothetical protein